MNAEVMKTRCQVWCLKSSICTRPKENIKFRVSNDMHQFLIPLPSGPFVSWIWNEKTQQPSVCDTRLTEPKTVFCNIAGETVYVTAITEIRACALRSSWWWDSLKMVLTKHKGSKYMRGCGGKPCLVYAALLQDHIQVHLPWLSCTRRL